MKKHIILAFFIGILSGCAGGLNTEELEDKMDEIQEKGVSALVSKPTITNPAPNFVAFDINNVKLSLEDLKGKTIVLEWFDDKCAYVRKHYDSSNMQNLQSYAADKDVVWITVTPQKSASGEVISIEKAKEFISKNNIKSAYFVIDEEGKLAKLFNASTAPEVFVINRRGGITYAGAIDNKPTSNPDDVKGALNYTKSAINALFNDAVFTTPNKPAYGCKL